MPWGGRGWRQTHLHCVSTQCTVPQSRQRGKKEEPHAPRRAAPTSCCACRTSVARAGALISCQVAAVLRTLPPAELGDLDQARRFLAQF